MNIAIHQTPPAAYADITRFTADAGFTMASDIDTCKLLRTLAASKPGGRFLELGTGTGLSTSWILVESDGGEWIERHKTEKYDYIFADTWHGKYLLLEEALDMLDSGGLYILDDMLPQPNWPDGHQEKAMRLVAALEARTDLFFTSQEWATGIIIGVKKYTSYNFEGGIPYFFLKTNEK
jgi:predicted O-methyltransferase YrrM